MLALHSSVIRPEFGCKENFLAGKTAKLKLPFVYHWQRRNSSRKIQGFLMKQSIIRKYIENDIMANLTD